VSTDPTAVHSWLLEYIERTRSGEILIGRELRQQLDRLEAHFTDPAIRVDFTEAHKCIRFIETQCRHYEAPFAGMPFILELFEKALIEAIHSFRVCDPDTGRWVRLYQDVLLLIGRRNGKTTTVSGLCFGEFVCGPMGTKILCSSNDYSQADLMFQAIDAMREQSPALARVTRKTINEIRFGNPKRPRRAGKFSYANRGSIRKISSKTGAKEGRGIAVGVVDEVHELKDSSSIMPIRQALGNQPEPLYIELTTEGFVAEGYLDGRLREARKVLAGELDRPRWLIWLYTQDSEAEVWRDERTWVKSNPGLGPIKQWGFLRGEVEEAKTNMATRAFALAKDFNIKQSHAEAWLPPEVIENDAVFDVACLRGAIALGGVDLSETTDLTSAKALVMRPESAEKFILSRYFIPETKLEKSPDEKDYRQWAKDGLVEICPGSDVDFGRVTAWFVSLFKEHGVRCYRVGYDGWHAKAWAKEMSDAGFDMERVPMDIRVLSDPMKLVEADLRAKAINYKDNPVDKWCLGNVGLKVDGLGRIAPVKVADARNRRIDGAVALIICYALLKEHRSEYLQALR